MTDFHIHIAPQGMLITEALHYVALAGCRGAGLVLRSDGSDFSALANMAQQATVYGLYADVRVLLGVELVYLPPALIPQKTGEAREAGAQIVLIHGEGMDGTVETGTNMAAVEAGADILAHPGLVDEATARYAAEKGVALEFCGCPRHALANAHVAAMAARYGCVLVQGSNAKTPHELLTRTGWKQLYQGAALPQDQWATLQEHNEQLLRRLETLARQ